MKLSNSLFTQIGTLKNAIGTRSWREAAALIIATRSNSMRNIKYLVTKRASKQSFYPSRLCFPGGGISVEDGSKEWIQFFKSFGINLEKQFLPKTVPQPGIYMEITDGIHLPKEITLRITAIRETFEECGILLCQSSDGRPCTSNSQDFATSFPNEDIRKWQKTVKDDPQSFISMCSKLNVIPDLDSLIEWSNWLTPTVYPSKLRFDTIYYMTIVENLPSVLVDPDEVSDYHIEEPEKLVGQNRNMEFSLATPPVAYEMCRLSTIKDFDSLNQLAKARQTKGMERWLPVTIRTKDGAFSCLPGDDLYPENPDFTTHIPIKDIEPKKSTCLEFQHSTKHHHRMQLYSYDKDPDIIVNIEPRFGHVY